MGSGKKKGIIEAGGYKIDEKSNIVIDGTKPVKERYFYGSQLPKNIKCWNKKKERYQHVELFSPVIYDLEDQMPAYDPRWEVYDNPKRKDRKIVKINYPKYYLEWWYKQRKRCIEGYEVGGVFITGDMYWYLNFWRIKSKKKGEGMIPPRFLDLDKMFFDYIEQARQENKNALFLKRRQIGFSEKVAAMAAKEYTLFPSSQTLIVAGLEEYATNTIKKTKLGLDSLSPDSQASAGREFYKRRLKENDGELLIAGFKIGGEVAMGYFSEVHAITVKDNPQAASGKSPTLVIMEEAGINPILIKVYNYILPSLQEQGVQDGKICIFIGTGGEMSKGVADMMELFYNPEKYNLLSVSNIYEDEVIKGATCCPFFPAYLYYVMDHDGNSYREASTELILKERKKRGNEKGKLQEFKTQMPLTPREAFSVSGVSPFNVDKLDKQSTYLLNTDAQEAVQYGRFERIEEDGAFMGVKWVPMPLDSDTGELDKDGDFKWPCMIFEHPERPDEQDKDHFEYRFGMQKYTNLYGAGTDSYDKDAAETSTSEGSFVVMKGYLNANTTSCLPACRITWRPVKKEKFYEQTALACIYYGECENLIEWSNISIFDWYKTYHYDYLLKERPAITYANVKDSRVNNRYGVDPNTKHVWIEHFADYIEDYYDNIFDLEAVRRFMIFRSKDHNCDITISYMLAWEGILDDVKKGYVPQNRDRQKEREESAPLMGYTSVNGQRVRL
jgi:hypothetical protein